MSGKRSVRKVINLRYSISINGTAKEVLQLPESELENKERLLTRVQEK